MQWTGGLTFLEKTKTMSQKKQVADMLNMEKHKKRGYKTAPDLSIVVTNAFRDEPALQLERPASTQGQAHTVPLYSTSKTSPGPDMLPLSWVENSSTNPTDHSPSALMERAEVSWMYKS